MTGVGIAAVLAAALPILVAFGAGIRYVVKLILDAYKQQVEATEAAKNSEITALNERIERHLTDIEYLRTENTDLRQMLKVNHP